MSSKTQQSNKKIEFKGYAAIKTPVDRQKMNNVHTVRSTYFLFVIIRNNYSRLNQLSTIYSTTLSYDTVDFIS